MSDQAEWTIRKNTFVGSFSSQTTNIRALMVHDIIFDVLGLTTEQVAAVQLEIGVKKFFVKVKTEATLRAVLARGQVDYVLPDGTTTRVSLADAGRGVTQLRVFRLPPEVNNQAVMSALSRYGTVLSCVEERWSAAYKLAGTLNGVRAVKMDLGRDAHVPSHIKIKGVEVLVFYDGQPDTCWKCNLVGHLFKDCPRRTINQPGGRRWETRNNSENNNNTGPSDDAQTEQPAASSQAPAAQSMQTAPPGPGPEAPTTSAATPTSTTPPATESVSKPPDSTASSGEELDSGEQHEITTDDKKKRKRKKRNRPPAAVVEDRPENTTQQSDGQAAQLPQGETQAQGSDVRLKVTFTAAQEMDIEKILMHKEAHLGKLTELAIQNVYQQVHQGRTFQTYITWFNTHNQNIGPGMLPPEESNPAKRKDLSPEITPAKKANCSPNDDDDDAQKVHHTLKS